MGSSPNVAFDTICSKCHWTRSDVNPDLFPFYLQYHKKLLQIVINLQNSLLITLLCCDFCVLNLFLVISNIPLAIFKSAHINGTGCDG